MQSDDEANPGGSNAGSADGTLGRIALKQVRVSRAEVEARAREANNAANHGASHAASNASTTSPTNTSGTGAARKGSGNPMNRLVPYLDLFERLGDEELSRLARAPTSAVESLRQQIEEVNRALSRYVDLLARLSDEELVRLTGASVKTIRFWRLSQPRHMQGETRRPSGDSASISQVSPQVRPEPSSAQSSGSMRRDETLASERSQPHELSRPSPEPASPSASGSATFVMDIED